MPDNWICWRLFLDEWGEFFLKPSQTTCGDVGAVWQFFLVFWPQDSTIFSSPHRALGWYRHTFSSRQFRNIFCWLEILNYCPDGGNGNFHCSSSFLKATSLICEAQLSFAAHQKYILCFFSLWWMIKGIWALFSLLFIFLWNRKPWLDNFMFIIHNPSILSAQNCEYEWEYTSEIFYYLQRVFEKNIYFIMRFSPIFNCFSSMKGLIFFK